MRRIAPQREKLEFEGFVKEAIPYEERRGLQFVFRRGSPLDPKALRMVAAENAGSIILVGDESRCAGAPRPAGTCSSLAAHMGASARCSACDPSGT